MCRSDALATSSIEAQLPEAVVELVIPREWKPHTSPLEALRSRIKLGHMGTSEPGSKAYG